MQTRPAYACVRFEEGTELLNTCVASHPHKAASALPAPTHVDPSCTTRQSTPLERRSRAPILARVRWSSLCTAEVRDEDPQHDPRRACRLGGLDTLLHGGCACLCRTACSLALLTGRSEDGEAHVAHGRKAQLAHGLRRRRRTQHVSSPHPTVLPLPQRRDQPAMLEEEKR